MSKLFKLKKWFTLGETAKHLTLNFGEDVTEADVLRLALDGHMVLSVNFQTSERGQCGKLIPIEDAGFQEIEFVKGEPPSKIYGGIRVQTGDEDTHILKFDGKVVRMVGVYDLPMIGGEKNEVENQYRELVGQQRIWLTSLDGAFVTAGEDQFIQILEDFDDNEYQSGSAAQLEVFERTFALDGISDDKAKEWRLKHKTDRAEFLKKRWDDPNRYYPAGGLSEDSVFVVRNDSLTELLLSVASESGEASRAATTDTPLETRERNTLLTIIAALCKEAKIPYDKPAKAAGLIQGIAATMDISIGETTIENHLKRVPNAIAGKKR